MPNILVLILFLYNLMFINTLETLENIFNIFEILCNENAFNNKDMSF